MGFRIFIINAAHTSKLLIIKAKQTMQIALVQCIHQPWL
jgi:hypothetical protein